MKYQSTRSKQVDVAATHAILQGISKEGGLFVPGTIPGIDFELTNMATWSYKELAYQIMRLFFDDMQEEDLRQCIECAYNEKFSSDQVAPVVINEKGAFLELFHGPTLAFKDMALSILPYLMTTSKRYRKEEQEIVILAATSGDTGKAALEGFADIEGTRIVVFYPEEGVSEVQKRQMTTQMGDNTLVIGIKGNFDDAQTGVKNIFTDKAYEQQLAERGFVLSSANSINIGRLIPQVVYYFYAYGQMLNKSEIKPGETINVVVPTGNFGNILAAYYAKNMGLPIEKLICASNENKVLYDFFTEGQYDRNREFHITNSPSMDILISSNLERLLFHISGEDTKLVSELMNELKETGKYSVNEKMKDKLKSFYAGYAGDEKTSLAIREVYETTGYLMDTHTAVAYSVYQDYVKEEKDLIKTIIVSTASPYKFSGSVMQAIGHLVEGKTDFELLSEMEELLSEKMPEGIRDLEKRTVRHKTCCEVENMRSMVDNFLK